MINPQEVMMALSPEERPIETHTHTDHFGDKGLSMSKCRF